MFKVTIPSNLSNLVLNCQNRKVHSGLLHLSPDWKLLSDLDEKLVFPSSIGIICLRQDIILFSTSIKTDMIRINLLLRGKYGELAPEEVL